MAEKNKITIEALTIMMQKGLNEVYNKLAEMDAKLDQKPNKEEVELMIEQKLSRKADKSDVERILTRVSMVGANVDDYRSDQFDMRRKVERHEKWHHQTADKIGIELKN